MKKSFVKLLLSGAMVLAGFAFVGCNDLDTEIAGINDRLTALEAEVDALQAAIDGGAVITSVDPTTNGVKVTLSNGKTFELTNGADGKDGANGANGTNGANGKDGSVVTIGENGNWFIDGKDTGLAAEGKAGAQGPAGKDGVYYYPHEDGFFHKVDGDQDTATEITWLPEGTVTAVWADGSLLLYNVEGVEEGEALEIVLSSSLKSLALVPETLLDSRGVIDFVTLSVVTEVDNVTYEDELEFVVSAPATAAYLVNPRNADLTNLTWDVLAYDVEVRSDDVVGSLISIDAINVTSQGTVVVDYVANGVLPEYSTEAEGEQVLVALQATDAVTGEVITSDFAYAQQAEVTNYTIINKKAWNDEDNAELDNSHKKAVSSYYFTMPAWAIDYKFGQVTGIGVDVVVDGMEQLQMAYDKPFDLDDYLETYYEGYGAEVINGILPDLGINPTYKVTMPEVILGTDETTNQQKFVNFDATTNVVTVNPEFASSAINRIPVFKVESQVENYLGEMVTVAVAYIPVKIVKEVVEPTPLEPLIVEVNGEFEYSDLVAPGAVTEDMEGVITLDWETVNKEIYKVLGMSHEEFVASYLDNMVYYTRYEDGEAYTAQRANEILVDGLYYNETTQTMPLLLQLTNQIDENAAGYVDFKFTATDMRDVIVRFNYSVSHNHTWPEFNPDYTLAEKVDGMTVIQVKGKLVDGAWKMVSEMKEHFKNYLNKYEDPANHGALKFEVMPEMPTEPQMTAAVTGADWKDQQIALTSLLYVDHKDFVVEMSTVLANGNKCNTEYVVRFVNPFVATLTDVTLKTFQATPDSQKILNNLVIKDRDGKVVYEKGAVTTFGLNTYKLAADAVTPTFTCTPDESFGNATVDGDLKLTLTDTPEWTLTWYNGGTDLQQNKNTTYAVSAQVLPVCVVSAEAKVTILSTENSKK